MYDAYYIVKVKLFKGSTWYTCGLRYWSKSVPTTDGYHEDQASAMHFARKIKRSRKDLHAVAVFHRGRVFYRP